MIVVATPSHVNNIKPSGGIMVKLILNTLSILYLLQGILTTWTS